MAALRYRAAVALLVSWMIQALFVGASEKTHPGLGELCRDIETSLRCPITREFFEEPYILSDGVTYELVAVSGWLGRGHITSPLTGKPLGGLDLVPNTALKATTTVYWKHCGAIPPPSSRQLEDTTGGGLAVGQRQQRRVVNNATELKRMLERRELELRTLGVRDERVQDEIFGRRHTLSVSTGAPSAPPSVATAATATTMRGSAECDQLGVCAGAEPVSYLGAAPPLSDNRNDGANRRGPGRDGKGSGGGSDAGSVNDEEAVEVTVALRLHGDSQDDSASSPSSSSGFGWRRVRGSLKIAHVVEGGQAARAGVRVGWIVVAVDSAPVQSEGDYKAAVSAVRSRAAAASGVDTGGGGAEKEALVVEVTFSKKWVMEGVWAASGGGGKSPAGVGSGRGAGDWGQEFSAPTKEEVQAAARRRELADQARAGERLRSKREAAGDEGLDSRQDVELVTNKEVAVDADGTATQTASQAADLTGTKAAATAAAVQAAEKATAAAAGGSSSSSSSSSNSSSSSLEAHAHSLLPEHPQSNALSAAEAAQIPTLAPSNQPVGYWRVDHSGTGRRVIVEAVTGRPLEIFGGVQGYASPDATNKEKGGEGGGGGGGGGGASSGDGRDGNSAPPSNTEDLEADRKFWRSMGSKHDEQRQAINQLRCLYHSVNEAKLSEVDGFSVEYHGKEAALLKAVAKKYGVPVPAVEECKARGHYDDGVLTLESDTVHWSNGDVYAGTWKVMPSHRVPLPAQRQQQRTPGKDGEGGGAGGGGGEHGGKSGAPDPPSPSLPPVPPVVMQRKMHGSGVFRYASGDYFQGDFRNGMRHGYGEYYWPTGMRYYGEWREDQRDGRGVFYDQNGRRTEDDYEKDKKSCSIPLKKVNSS